jgi:PKD repeat protein
MFQKRPLLLVILSVVLFIILQSGCDKLVTEKILITEAGHPIADFDLDSGFADTGCAPYTVAFTDESVGPYNRWLWKFGDGDSSLVDEPTHTYDTAGLYTVSLTIRNTEIIGFDTETKKRYIYIGSSNASFAVENDSSCAGIEVTFTPQIINTSKTYSWTFGDNKVSSDSIATNVYDSAGFYWVHLTTTDYCGTKVDSALVAVAECPTIVIKADTTIGCAPFDVIFNDSSYTGDSTTLNLGSRIWIFGNGESVSGVESDTIRYDTAGVYTVRLTIKSNDGSTYIGGTSVDSVFEFITVYKKPEPHIGLLSDPTGCKSQYQPFRVHFTDSTVGDYDSLLWVFGDDDSSRAISPIHEYNDPGKYSVTLTAYSEHCSDAITTRNNFILLYDILHDSSTYFSTVFDSLSTDLALAYYTFADTSKGLIDSREWDFGDGTDVETDQTVWHSFDRSLDFDISLTVTNGCNSVIVDTTITARP